MKLKDIKPNPNNPRVLRDDKFQKLKQSIQEFPKMLSLRPIVIDENNVVLGGNMRLRALQDLGFTDLDDSCVKYANDLTEEEKKRFIIADNVAFGEWDWETLANDWDVADLEAWGLEIPNFDEEPEQLEVSEDDYDVPEGGMETDIVIGDLFEIGEHRLLCGDSTDASDVAFLFDGKLADMVMTDPPYNVDYSSKNKMLNYSDKGNRIQDDIENDKMDDNLFDNFIFEFYKNFKDITKEGGSWYVWSPAGNTETKFRNQWNESGLLLKQCLVWVKNNFVLGRQDYQWKHESCLYGWKEGAAHYFIDDRTKKTVIEDELDYKKLSKSEIGRAHV